MAYYPTAQDLRLLRQSNRTCAIQLEILDKNFAIIDRIDGLLIDDSYTVDAESDIRRTGSVTVHVANDMLLANPASYIWFQKYVRVRLGVLDEVEHDYSWKSIGVFLWDQATYTYDATSHTLTLNCLDLMANLTASYGSQISGYGTTIPVGSSIANAIRSTVTELGGAQDYSIDMDDQVVPYDLEFGTGAYPYDIVKELRDLYVGYESFFDDTRFVCRRYPTYASDQPVMTADILSPLVQSENITKNFAAVHNVTEVWGGTQDMTWSFSDTSMTFYDSIAITTQTSVPVQTGDYVTIQMPSDYQEGYQINYIWFRETSTETEQGIQYDGIHQSIPYKAGEWFVVVVNMEAKTFSYEGSLDEVAQIVAVNKLVSKNPSDISVIYGGETMTLLERDKLTEPTKNVSYTVDPATPFALDKIGERRQVLSGGEYANIYTVDLADQRAKYETWLASDMLDTISLTMIEVPWLEVNSKIEYRSFTTGETKTYLIKRKSGSISSCVMTIECVVFKPTYAWTN